MKIEPKRALEILAERLEANPTTEELRSMMQGITEQEDHSNPWIGISAAREIVMQIAMASNDSKFRAEIINSKEFADMMPLYRPYLMENYDGPGLRANLPPKE